MIMDEIRVFVEEGHKKTFAVVQDWPGWSRWGKDESSALAAMLASGPRYAQVAARVGLAFEGPTSVEAFKVVDRMEGNATTSFGAPDGCLLPLDTDPLNEEGYQRSVAILRAAWEIFDQADEGYLKRLAQPFRFDLADPLEVHLEQVREVILIALVVGMKGEIPENGPRGRNI